MIVVLTIQRMKGCLQFSQIYFVGQPLKWVGLVQQIEEAAKKGLIDRHVFAAGGMNIDNVKLAKDYGFGGVVIRGDLWSRFDIHNETDFKDLMAHFEKLRKVVG